MLGFSLLDGEFDNLSGLFVDEFGFVFGLTMPALVAIKHNPDIKAQYERLLANGKYKMQAVCAAMRKLVHIHSAIATPCDSPLDCFLTSLIWCA